MKYVWQQEKGSGAGLERKSASKSDAVGTEDRIQSRKQAAEGRLFRRTKHKVMQPHPHPMPKIGKVGIHLGRFSIYVAPPQKKSNWPCFGYTEAHTYRQLPGKKGIVKKNAKQYFLDGQ